MSIEIIKEPTIYLTAEENERYRREWERENMFTTQPMSFEVWVRRRKQNKDMFFDMKRIME